jgi:hypothetical protein
MNWRRITFSAVFMLLVCQPVMAGNHFGSFFNLGKYWPNCVSKVCCDDYCPKPLPCVQQVGCGVCDDYCSKPVPCTKQVCCFGCDDYCKKCLPPIKCPPCTGLICPSPVVQHPPCRAAAK